MKKKYTNQASKYHSSIYSEGGDKSKSSPNFTGRNDDIQSKKLEKTEIPETDAAVEMKNRTYANTPDSENTHPYESQLKKSMKKDYEAKDKDLKNAIDKKTLERKVKKYEERENKMGGSKAVTKKIKRREWYKKNAGDIRTGAGVAAGGTYATFKKEVDKFVGDLFSK
jgi:hypothetical protein